MDAPEDVVGHVQEPAPGGVQDAVLDVPEGVQEIVEVAVQVDALVTVELAVQVDAPEDVLLDVLVRAMEAAQLTVLTVVRVNGHEAVSSTESE